MKYCMHCGSPLDDTAKFCAACGHQIHEAAPTFTCQPTRSNSLQNAAKIFLIISIVFDAICILLCLLTMLIDPAMVAYLFVYCPLICCAIPMTIHYFKNTEQKIPCGTAYKVCVLLFVNQIAGILMLCDKE